MDVSAQPVLAHSLAVSSRKLDLELWREFLDFFSFSSSLIYYWLVLRVVKSDKSDSLSSYGK